MCSTLAEDIKQAWILYSSKRSQVIWPQEELISEPRKLAFNLSMPLLSWQVYYRVWTLASCNRNQKVSENNPESPHLGKMKRMCKQCVPGAPLFFFGFFFFLVHQVLYQWLLVFAFLICQSGVYHMQQFMFNLPECPACHMCYNLARVGCMHFRCTQCPNEFCSGCGGSFKNGRV